MSKNFQYPNGPLKWIASPKDFEGDNLLSIHAVETIQRYVFGTRFVTWDGRVFKYGHSNEACKSGYGAFNQSPPLASLGADMAVAAAIGDKQVSLTIEATAGFAAGGAVAKDELAGGYVVMGNDSANSQTRLIIGNTAVASGGGTIILDLETPVAYNALTTSDYTEIFLNPYAHLGNASSSSYQAVMGVSAVTTVATYNAWFQTWGPCWVTPGGGDASPGDTVNDREMFFVGDGSVNAGTSLTLETGYQRAGFIIDATASGTSASPLLMLQISI